MAANDAAANGDESLYDSETLSDVLIQFGRQQQLRGHKAVLARKCKYFYKAFSGQFSVASSKVIELGDDEDPEAIKAMIRHIYDLPYDQMLEGSTVDGVTNYNTNQDLLFHIDVFTAADKYDVASLRPLVVKKFKDLMEIWRSSPKFATSIQKLMGPSAGHLADDTLQAAAVEFCAKNLRTLIHVGDFVNIIQEEEPFAGRLLASFLNECLPDGTVTIQLKTCKKPSCRHAKPSAGRFRCLTTHCIVCATSANTELFVDGRHETGLVDYKMANIV
ncbi:hypothetical protein KCU95_g5253, partial [Aureobasidium melanogenum]